jgi:hypothetical protein
MCDVSVDTTCLACLQQHRMLVGELGSLGGFGGFVPHVAMFSDRCEIMAGMQLARMRGKVASF